MPSRRVRDVMTPDPWVVAPDDPVGDAWATMKNHGFRHLPVVDGGRVVGILSTSDVGRYVAQVPELMVRRVADFMTPNPTTIAPDLPIEAAAAQMALRKFNCLPVVEKGQLVGIVTTFDLLDALVQTIAPPSTRIP